MALFDRSYTTFYWLAIVSIAVCCNIFKLFDIEWSLKVIQTDTIRKLGCGFLFAFHRNYCRIFNRLRYAASKNSVTLKTGFGCLRSLKMAPFERSHTTFYWYATVNIALSCTVFELFDVE